MEDLVLMIGTNIGDRSHNIEHAIRRLNSFFGTPTLRGDYYETEPWGYESEDYFYNVAIIYQTDLLPIEVLHVCKSIEIEMGRRKTLTNTYENRIIDIDIILYGNIVVDEPHLHIPHHQLTERKFVLQPLNDIIPNYVHPVLHKTVNQLFTNCTDNLYVRRLSEDKAHSDKKHFVSPYSYVAIEGCIGAGKTSLATLLAKDFNAKLILEQFDDNPFLPKFYDDHDKYAFPLELSFLASRYRQLHETFSSSSLFHRTTFADYFITKSLIFAGETLEETTYRLYMSIFNAMMSSIPKPDILVYLFASVDKLQYNIKLRGRSYEQNISGDYLDAIQERYLTYIRQHPTQRILLLDINNIDFVKNERDYEKIREIFTMTWENENKIIKL